eukprot:jgi/Botrbrau1/12721/Bobra.67_1s0084.1
MTDYKKDGIETSSWDAQDFDAIEREFQEVLHELVGDKSLERFCVEYEKVFQALCWHGSDTEKRLAKKCRELNAEIVANAAKVAAALQLSEEDQAAVNAMKKEVEKAWKLVDAAHEKDARQKEVIAGLKQEVGNLTRLVEAGAGLTLGQESAVNDLLKQKDELQKEHDAQAAEMMEKARQTESERSSLELDLLKMKDLADQRKAEVEREQRRKERLEKEVRELKSKIDAKQGELRSKAAATAAAEEQVHRMEQLLREAQATTDKVQKEYNAVSERVSKLQHDLEEQIHTNTRLLAENSSKAVALHLKEEAIASTRAEAAKVGKAKEALLTKLKSVDKQRSEAERERDEQMCAQNSTKHQEDLLKIQDNTRKNLEAEIARYNADAAKDAAMLLAMERERDALAARVTELATKLEKMDEVEQLRDADITEQQKKIAEAEDRLKQQQKMYEAVRAERNTYSKNLIQAQDEMLDMKRKTKFLAHQIEQLKEEIGAKDVALVKEHFECSKVEKEKESLTLSVRAARERLGEIEASDAGNQAEIKKLTQIVQEAELVSVHVKRRSTIWVVGERDMLGTQLVRQNDEVALLYQKIRLQQAALQQGQKAYSEKLTELRLLRIKEAETAHELHLLKNSVAAVDVLKQEVHHLGRDLLRERTRVKALSEELETPLNVHRWRKLEGTDPTAYELIMKCQTLQKRLINRTEQIVDKDLQLLEKEKLYTELKLILSRQPGPELAQQLSTYQAELREKMKQVKVMSGELQAVQAKVNEDKYEIERLKRELHDTRHQYFAAKRRERDEKERKERERAAESAPIPLLPAPSDQPRFAGGGYALAATAA